MEGEFRDGRLYLHRDQEERAPIVHRLNRIEGQVRGLRQMIEDDRYCLDEINQVNAIVAAIREVAVLVISQHLGIAAECMARGGAERDALLEDVANVLRAALRQ